MKVLQEGNPNGWEIEQECTGKGNGDGGCKARLLVSGNDIFVTAHTDFSGDTDYYYTFKCPCCGAWTDIPERDVPINVRGIAMDKYRNRKTIAMETYRNRKT